MSEAKIPIEALEGLMKKVFLDKKVEPGLFWDAVLKSNLYIPLSNPDKAESGSLITHNEKKWPVQMGLDAKGNSILWLFTSPDIMFEYTEEQFSHLELEGQNMFSKIKDIEFEVILIGPEQITLSLAPPLIQTLAEGKTPSLPEETYRNIAKDAKVNVGKPVDNTKALEKEFSKIFKKNAEISEALFMQISDDAGSRLLLGLKMKEENRDQLRRIAGLVAKAAEGVLEPGKTMDVTFVNGSLKDAFAKWGKSFYKKKK